MHGETTILKNFNNSLTYKHSYTLYSGICAVCCWWTCLFESVSRKMYIIKFIQRSQSFVIIFPVMFLHLTYMPKFTNFFTIQAVFSTAHIPMLTTNSVKTKSRYYFKQENQHQKKMFLQGNRRKNKKCQKLIEFVVLWRPCKIK
jgi:hypothetical protein